MMPLSLQIILAFAMDLFIGDPKGYPHPVKIIGCMARRLEIQTRNFFANPVTAGAVTTGVVVGGTFTLTWVFLWGLDLIHPMAASIGSIIIIYTCISVRSLYDESRPVLFHLNDGQIDLARKSLKKIVGRNTEHLNQSEISRATVETVAESTVDGIISPLFYACVGGAPLALAFKAVSTLDSMFGYRNETYNLFGRFPARLDDAANWIPARLAGVLMAVASALMGYDGLRSWKTVRQDGAKHLSPNAGIPEAAMAGALGIRLGGSNYYGIQRVEKPFIGSAGKHEVNTADINHSHKIMFVSSVLTLVLFIIVRHSLGGV